MSSKSNTRPSISVGKGVPRAPVIQAPPEPEPEKPPEVEMGTDGNPLWSDAPTFADQLSKYPQLCEIGPVTTRTFNLDPKAKDNGVDEMNALMARAEPKSAPGIIMGDLDKQFYEGKWYVLFMYRKVRYKKLIDKGTK